jgi:hypothetical protein
MERCGPKVRYLIRRKPPMSLRYHDIAYRRLSELSTFICDFYEVHFTFLASRNLLTGRDCCMSEYLFEICYLIRITPLCPYGIAYRRTNRNYYVH